jgi:hypothetical protein
MKILHFGILCLPYNATTLKITYSVISIYAALVLFVVPLVFLEAKWVP